VSKFEQTTRNSRVILPLGQREEPECPSISEKCSLWKQGWSFVPLAVLVSICRLALMA
jgi:hypothetical protein